MKKQLLSFGVALMLSASFFAQTAGGKGAVVPVNSVINKNVPTQTLQAPNLEQLRAEDLQRDKNGELYRIGVPIFTNITTVNSGVWTTQPNGDRVWELKVKSTGAEALSFIFSNFKLYGNSVFTVSDLNGVLRHKPVSKEDMLEDFQQHLALCFGDELILRLVEPAGTLPSEIHMDRVMYNYRSTGNPNVAKINESEACEINVNCSPVGDAWQDEKRGVARIYIVDSSGAGWCSGSLVNNTAQDCKPLFLTALHCGVSTSAANSNLWKFYFKYESPNCTNPSVAGTLDDYFITGCVRKAHSNDGGGNTGSDFLLVQLGSAANEATTISTLKTANFNAYWNGWDANNTAVTGGAGIHHPAGDIKKISTFTATTTSQTYGGSTPNTHWRFSWSANANGHGVTEGGSSGSPVFKSNGRIFGTLTGGSSFCTALTAPDLYGKMSYHWTSNSTNTAYQLKTFLDPTNTGALVLDGSADPCSAPAAPVANFSANQTNIAPGTTVTFTDLTSGLPTSWAWSISPGTAGVDWSYTGGTSAASQNPQVIFNTVGQYTITLVATNGQGSDSEVKTNYIIVAIATGPCAASSTIGCAAGDANEYISTVQLNTINNTSACSGYTDYSAISTTLTKTSSYTATIVPSIMGGSTGAYTSDELAIWIDWNDDNDFADAGEQVGYVMVATGWSNQFNFTVPATATVGTVKMRCRISYQPDDGTIAACGDSQWGEVEDYSIVIQAAPTAVLTLSCGSNQTVYASTQTTMPNVTGTATASTTCAGGAVTVTQSPAAGTALSNGANNVTITATDLCGNTQTCQMTITYVNNLGLNDLNMFSFVTLYPNPVTDNLTIDLSTVKNEDVTVEIFDMSGKLLMSENNQNGSLIVLKMTDLSNGLYQVKLTSSTAQIMKRISKM
jgi:PKD repeat protein